VTNRNDAGVKAMEGRYRIGNSDKTVSGLQCQLRLLSSIRWSFLSSLVGHADMFNLLSVGFPVVVNSVVTGEARGEAGEGGDDPNLAEPGGTGTVAEQAEGGARASTAASPIGMRTKCTHFHGGWRACCRVPNRYSFNETTKEEISSLEYDGRDCMDGCRFC
jgi:hypothetical protein